jgi:Trp operon repressor
MKKKLILFILLHISFITVCHPQNIMHDIQICFGWLKNDIKLKLDSCRTNPDIGDLHYGYLEYKLIEFLRSADASSLHRKTWEDVKKHLDSLNIQFSWQMVYDDNMVERIIQLLNNEYQQDELNTLINKNWQRIKNKDWQRITMYAMRADTFKIFKHTVDSLNAHRDKNIHKSIYQDEEVFQFLRLDTTARFCFVLDSVIKSERRNILNDYLDNYHFDIEYLIKVCGYVNDKRFVESLLKLLDQQVNKKNKLELILTDSITFDERAKLVSEKSIKENLIHTIKHALIRMKIEPYHSDFLKSCTLTIEELKEKSLVRPLQTFSTLLHTQESFLELSKYLHSSAHTMLTGDGPVGTAYKDAYWEIKKYIENKSLWDIINKPDFNLENDRFVIYEWMQENYGKYEIKRLW